MSDINPTTLRPWGDLAVPSPESHDDWLTHRPTNDWLTSFRPVDPDAEHVRKSLKFLGVARELAKNSKDRSTQVGAVALGPDYELLGGGYNGFPRGVNDDIEARHERPAKYQYTSHAEENIIAAAARKGVALMGAHILVTALFPCTTCSRLMIQAGIKSVIAPRVDNARWADEARVALEMLTEAGVRVHYYDTSEG